MKRNILLIVLLVSFGARAQQSAKPKPDLWAITKDYLTAFEEINFDEMGTFLHDSVTFFDITSKALGKNEVIQNWKNTFIPLPQKIKFEIDEYFVSGNFVVVNLRYEAMIPAQGKNTVVNIDVITVLKYKDGKIIFLHDYSDIDSYINQMTYQMTGKLSSGVRNENIKVVEDFYQAYTKWNVPGMVSFYGENIEFKDLTAKEAFPRSAYEHSGKENVTAFWSGIFGDIQLSYIDVKLNSAYSAGNFVIANSTFSMVLPKEWMGEASGKVFISIPIKTLFQVRDGKIVTHYDFADYRSYNKQIQAQLVKP